MALPNTNMKTIKDSMSKRVSVGDFLKNAAAGRYVTTDEPSVGGFLQNASTNIASTGAGMGQLALLAARAAGGDQESQNRLKMIAKNLPSGVLDSVLNFIKNPAQTAYKYPVSTAMTFIAPMASKGVSAAKVAAVNKLKNRPGFVNLESEVGGGKTIGQMQQSHQNPDLTAYENAFNSGDQQVLNSLASKYPGDARFQVHKTLTGHTPPNLPEARLVPPPVPGRSNLLDSLAREKKNWAADPIPSTWSQSGNVADPWTGAPDTRRAVEMANTPWNLAEGEKINKMIVESFVNNYRKNNPSWLRKLIEVSQPVR